MIRLLDILSKACSVVLYPMLMPMYGMLLFCYKMWARIPEVSSVYWLVCLLGTLLLTLVIPVVMLLYMRKKGHIDTLQMTDAKQRTMPYIYTLMCYLFWGYFIHIVVKLPSFILVVVLGASISLLSVTIINHWWKISAHLTGIGGLLGGICSYGICYSTLPFYPILIVLILALLLMYSRIHLRAHTPMQVVCGFLLGLLFTCIPNMILYHA